MLAPTTARPLAPYVLDARDALVRTFECAFDLWQRDHDGRWRLVEPMTPAWNQTARNDAAVEQTATALEAACAGNEACCTAWGAAQCVLAVPLREPSGVTRCFAIALLDAGQADLACQLAELLLRDLQQRQEIDWLRDENMVFSQQVTDDFEELTFLRSMATQMVVDDTTLDIRSIVAQAVAGLREMIGGETVVFFRPDADGGLAPIVRSSSRDDGQLDALTPLLANIARDHAADASAGPVVRNDIAETDPRAAGCGLRQFLMVAVAAGVRRFGWFVAANRSLDGRKWTPSPLLQLGQDEFGTWEASLLSTAATLLASHASNLELVREKEQLLVNTVRSLVTALDSKDAYTRGHSERVALYSKCISRTMGYDATESEKLYLAGLLHDVGKIGVSDAVLRKPDKLTDEEFAEIKRHPDEGWAILRDLEQMRYVLPGVLHHHEQVSGAGYPDGLTGDAIPLDARIMAVADAYDAMTSDRAYRAGMPHERAMSILHDGAGEQWDQRVVQAFESIVDEIAAIRYGYRPAEREPRTASALAPSCQSSTC